jgi:RimJ/RimL family protein N-acetyltransferase
MIAFNDHTIGREIAKGAGVQFNPACDISIARTNGERVLGGVIFQSYTGASITIHAVGFDPRWLSQDLLWVIFHYAFVQLGCKVVFGQVKVTNSKALEFDLKLGFKEVARVDDVYPDGAMALLAMRREECRWLKIKPRGLMEPQYG